MDYSQHALKRHEDTAYVNDGLARLMHHGTGATIQRDRFHAGGFNATLEEATASIANEGESPDGAGEHLIVVPGTPSSNWLGDRRDKYRDKNRHFVNHF